MAVIVFYEATPVDTFQLTNGLQGTDHYWEYVYGVITPENINPNAEVISVFVDSVLTQEIMKRMPKLKLIATRSSGVNHIDLDYAKQRNITVVNVPNFGENTVAEHTFALLLMLARKLPDTINSVKDGSYSPAQHIGIDLIGKTIGIIGMGKIGSFMASISKGFQMDVLAYDISPKPDLAEKLGFKYTDMVSLLERSDIVSLHIPLSPESYHLINPKTIQHMKRGVILLNTARGELVDNRALVRALASGHIAGAGLDTIEGEKFLKTSSIIGNLVEKAAAPESYLHTAEAMALLRMKNVVITPHSAYNTIKAISRINTCTTKNIIDFWYGNTPNKVNIPHSSGKLVIVRHGQSEWNALGKWTGTTDVSITSTGIQESIDIGKKIMNIPFDFAYISQQIRTKETLDAIKKGANQPDLNYEETASINERDYGIYTGMRKNDIKKIIGDKEYDLLRRSWDGPVEGGESLKDVYERAVPFYLRIILPRLLHGQNILVVAHGNSIRSLVKYIENISDADIGNLEMIQGCALSYEVNKDGRMKHKEVILMDTTEDNEP